MTIILDGKALSAKKLIKLTENISKLEKKPKLAVILLGDDPAGKIYTSLKQKRAKAIGIDSLMIELPYETPEYALLEHIDVLNEDPDVNAILVQLPLPNHIDVTKVLTRITPEKDVDGFTPLNIGLLAEGSEPNAYPCTPLGVVKLLNEYKIEIEGKHAVIVGRSNIVGKPLSLMLLEKNATVTICHSRTQNLAVYTKTADILISAVGKPHTITKDMVKPNAIIIDVGISRLDDGKVTGDVDFHDLQNIAGAITPVPGGVGPMTIAMLLENTYKLYCLQQNH